MRQAAVESLTPKRRRRRRLGRLVVVAGSILVAPLLAEAIVQLVGDPRLKELEAAAHTAYPASWRLNQLGMLVADDDAEMRYRLRPGFDRCVGGVEYRVNDVGLRGGPIARPRPAGTKRVLFVGDSYAFGLGVSEADSIQGQLQAQLREPPVEVVDFGVPGYQTGQELALLERCGFALEPDLVVLLYCANDNVASAWTYAPSISELYIDDLPLPCSWKPTLSRSYLYSQVARIDARRRDLAEEYDYHNERNWPLTAKRLRAMAKACHDHGVAFLIAPLPDVTDAKELHDDDSQLAIDHARVTTLANAEQWPMVDLRRELLARAPGIGALQLSRVPPTDNHFNREGCRVVAEAIAPAVERLLADQRAGAAAPAPTPESAKPSR